MTERLYYTDPALLEFEARFVSFVGPSDSDERVGLVLDRTAFYPTSGGQLFDTGRLGDLRVSEVTETPDGNVVHYVELPESYSVTMLNGAVLRGAIDAARRRDHMQQHTGQHLLSATFIELFKAPTVSFHMGDESCTIDLDIKALTERQVREAERRANEVLAEDRPVEIRWATPEEARALGVRKIPPDIDKLRLIDIRDYDLTACGGTHVSRTGQIGAILLRKTEKVKQGVRVEFVCGGRAVDTARRDFDTLTEAAALFSGHIYDVPAQTRKTLDEAKVAGKRQFKVQEDLAELMAEQMLANTAEWNGLQRIVRRFDDRDLAFIKLLAQKLTVPRSGVAGEDAGATVAPASRRQVVALLATTMPQPALVFAQSPGGPYDMGALMKQAMAALGGRGGGTPDMAQGGAPAGADVDSVLAQAAAALQG